MFCHGFIPPENIYLTVKTAYTNNYMIFEFILVLNYNYNVKTAPLIAIISVKI